MLHFGLQLQFEVELLLHEACFILRRLLGLELRHNQDFGNATTRVSIILELRFSK